MGHPPLTVADTTTDALNVADRYIQTGMSERQEICHGEVFDEGLLKPPGNSAKITFTGFTPFTKTFDDSISLETRVYPKRGRRRVKRLGPCASCKPQAVT
jgi:hypothetical protein